MVSGSARAVYKKSSSPVSQGIHLSAEFWYSKDNFQGES